MGDRLPIHDLFVRWIDRRSTGEGSALTVLRYSDHLLRRFGLAEFVELGGGQQRTAPARPVADEAWALVHGQVEFHWEDQREGSPSFGQEYRLQASRPVLVLVPFGVAFRIRSLDGGAGLVRLSTHEEEP